MKIEYDAIIQKDEDHNGAYCDIPFNVLETFGKKRVKIKAIIDTVEYRGLLTPMGGKYGLFMNKEVRDKVGKTYGETVHISIEEDTEPRVVEIPQDLLEAMLAADVNHSSTACLSRTKKNMLNGFWMLRRKKLAKFE